MSNILGDFSVIKGNYILIFCQIIVKNNICINSKNILITSILFIYLNCLLNNYKTNLNVYEHIFIEENLNIIKLKFIYSENDHSGT